MMTRVTSFGAQEVDRPDIYKNYQERTIIATDCLCALEDIFGEALKTNRDNIYRMVSGDCSDEDFRQLLKHHYRHIPTFTDYIDSVILTVKEEGRSRLVKEIFYPIRCRIENFFLQSQTHLDNSGGKYLMKSHDKLYYAIAHDEFELRTGMYIFNK